MYQINSKLVKNRHGWAGEVINWDLIMHGKGDMKIKDICKLKLYAQGK